MTLRMGDGPVANLPAGLDAYAGYDDVSGIGETYPAILTLPAKYHLSISTVPGVAAMCGDVESGALASWIGYRVGYCDISSAQGLINRDGRPKKLWTAHHNNVPHICTSACGFGFTGVADGTQWTNHGGAWDESLLNDSFFQLGGNVTTVIEDANKTFIGVYGPTGIIPLEPAEVAWANQAFGPTVVGMPNTLIARINATIVDQIIAAFANNQNVATNGPLFNLVIAACNNSIQQEGLPAAIAKIPTTSQPVSLKGETATLTFD